MEYCVCVVVELTGSDILKIGFGKFLMVRKFTRLWINIKVQHIHGDLKLFRILLR